MKKTHGLTLIEVIVVIAIIAVVAALIFPVVASAQKNGKGTATLSNLKQCYTAMYLYVEDGNWSDLPQRQVAQQVLASAPTKDPLDTWTPAVGNLPAPFIGSYAYIRADDYYTGRIWERVGSDRFNMFASIFVSNKPVKPDVTNGLYARTKDLEWPDRVAVVTSDGTVLNKPWKVPASGVGVVTQMFSWSNIFEKVWK